MRVASVCVAVALAACTDAEPVRIVAGRTDTLVVNHRREVSLPVAAVNAQGDTVVGGIASWRRVSGDDVQLTDSGTVHCTQNADAVVEARSGNVARQFTLFCRPLKGVLFGEALTMRPDGEPVLYGVPAIGLDDQPVTMLAASVAILDTNIARIEGDRVRPRRIGATEIVVRAGDCQSRVAVDVVARVDDPFAIGEYAEYLEPVQLVANEYRTWKVPSGHLMIRLDADTAAHERLVLGALNANCARARNGGVQAWSCITSDSTIVVLRRRGASAGSDHGTLVLRRAPWGRYSSADSVRRAQRGRVPRPAVADTMCPTMFGWVGRPRTAAR